MTAQQAATLPNEQAETLAIQAYQRLREMILSLQLKPNEQVSEASLSKLLGIGRTPVREALQRLYREKLVEILPRRCVVIAGLDIRVQLQALEVRRPMEAILISRAARRSTPQQRQEFQRLAGEMEQHWREPQLYMELDRQYDDLIDLCADNPFATDYLRPIHFIVRRFWTMMNETTDWEICAQLHHAVIRAVAAGDADKAVQCSAKVMDHNEAVFRRLTD